MTYRRNSEYSHVSFNECELPIIFPEAKTVVEEKIAELKKEAYAWKNCIKKKLVMIRERSAPKNQWFWKAVVAVLDGKELYQILRNIKRLERILRFYNHEENQNIPFEVNIENVKSIPIQEVLSLDLRKSGNKLIGLCPLHKEKTPSFVIYIDTNSFYCFGCNQGGNIINLIRLLYGYSFIDAIKYLQKYARY